MKEERFLNIWQDMPNYNALRDRFFAWEYYPIYEAAMKNLNHDVLYKSYMHGVGHIHRVMLLGALLCMLENLNEEDTRLAMEACSYHDTGRIDDSLDDGHGARSAANVQRITGRDGDDLAILRAAMTVHSISDARRAQVMEACAVEDIVRGNRITSILKDADGLDRVRIWDLDTKYLRTDSAQQLVEFSYALCYTYHKIKE